MQDVGTGLLLAVYLRKRAVLQQIGVVGFRWDSCVAKRYCITESIGDTFVQC